LSIPSLLKKKTLLCLWVRFGPVIFVSILGYGIDSTQQEEEEEEEKLKEAKLPTFWHLRYYLKPILISAHNWLFLSFFLGA
jgi:hypothetical protein